MAEMDSLLPGTEVEARGLRWELVLTQSLGQQTLYRLRGLDGVPAVQGERYRPVGSPAQPGEEFDADADDAEEIEDADEEPARSKKAKIEWIEAVPPGSFYLRVGLGRKSTGSYYTPHSFVRFLVQETLGPQVTERSPKTDPRPGKILTLRVLDPAMGSGHFLVEACRFLGEKLYEACRLCDDRALDLERRAESQRGADREKTLHEAAAWRARVEALPDGSDEIVRYLPSRAPEGRTSGLSQKKADALCRRLVAVHCLYGVDKNPLAVELAKVSLWIEAHAEGLPLTFLDHRLVVGDSLTGPLFEHLLTYPGTQQPLNDLYTTGLRERLKSTLVAALGHVRSLEADVGPTIAAYRAKEHVKSALDAAIGPLRVVAAAWAGGVMLGLDCCDDTAYANLARAVTRREPIGELLRTSKTLEAMVARGLGLSTADLAEASVDTVVGRPDAIPALPFDLAYPEVFFQVGSREGGGFDAVLGNPPWDAIQFKSKEFFAAFNFDILSASTRGEREDIEKRLIAVAAIGRLFHSYKEDFEQLKRANDALYEFQKVTVDGDLAGRQIDAFRVFMERNAQLLGSNGRTGVLVPSAFHANEGATGVRRLYLEKMRLACCFSFENLRKLFEIDSRFKFAAVVADRRGPTTEFPCAFYLHDDEWLFGDRGDRELRYSLEFVKRVAGAYLNLPEIENPSDLSLLEAVAASSPESVASFVDRTGICFRMTELHTTHDSFRFRAADAWCPGTADPRLPDARESLLSRRALVLYEGKYFHQFNDAWSIRPRFVVPMEQLLDRPDVVEPSRYYRLAVRKIARSNDERTAIAHVAGPGAVFSDSTISEKEPSKRPARDALLLAAVINSFCFDWLLRKRVAANVNVFLLRQVPMPTTQAALRLVVHGALRLSANHSGYEALWRTEMGGTWRESSAPETWPMMASDADRSALRAVLDAVIAYGYGLDSGQYATVLASFRGDSSPNWSALCVERHREVETNGLSEFVRRHDPYWDIPLNGALAKPVIDLPLAGDAAVISGRQLGLGFGVNENERPLPGGARDPQVAGLPSAGSGAGPIDEEAYARLRCALCERGVVTSTDAQTLLAADAASVRPLLARLVDEGHAVKEGQRRGVRYVAAARGEGSAR